MSSTPAEGTTPGKADMTQPGAAPCGVSSPLKRPLQVIRCIFTGAPSDCQRGLNELQIPGFTGPMRLTRSGRLIRLVVPQDPSASPTSPAKWWCKWWCIYRASSPRSQCWPPFSKAVQRTPSPFFKPFWGLPDTSKQSPACLQSPCHHLFVGWIPRPGRSEENPVKPRKMLV